MKCWAESRGGCDKKSLEHYVSQSVFSTDKVKVKGFHWCKDEEKEIGLASLGRHILCRHHNSLLTPLDSEAKRFIDALRYSGELSDQRSKLKPKRWSVHRKSIDGYVLERWFLKTLLNLTIDDKDKFIMPLEKIVQLVFGEIGIAKPMGIYMSTVKGHEFTINEKFSIAPVWRDDAILVGGIIEFAGFRFIFAFKDISPLVAANHSQYRLRRINFEVGDYKSLKLRFNW